MGEKTKLDSQLSFKSRTNPLLVPFKPILYPIQLQLESVVQLLRLLKGVFLWDNSYASFWVTACSFILFIVTWIIPWRFIIRWTSRILVWTFLGPWMKFVDKYYYEQLEKLSDEEQALHREAAEKQRREAWDKVLVQFKIQKEEAFKLRDIKASMFGEYAEKIPYFNRAKFRDVPRSDSYAKAVSPNDVSASTCNHIILPGQHLVGTMIPVLEKPSLDDSTALDEPKSSTKVAEYTKLSKSD